MVCVCLRLSRVKQLIDEFRFRDANNTRDVGQNTVQSANIYRIVVRNSQTLSITSMRSFQPYVNTVPASYLVFEPLEESAQVSS